mgnify:CR=1 FL=1
MGDAMRQLLCLFAVTILLLIALTIAAAATVAEAVNDVGGPFVLTDEPCKEGKGKLAYSVEPGVGSQDGCWSLYNGVLYIFWLSNGYTLRYDPSDFHAPKKPDQAS